MILIIDHHDSFTGLLADMVRSLGFECVVWQQEDHTLDDVIDLSPQAMILSPGPGHPREALLARDILISDLSMPILGICLGHQVMGMVYGGGEGNIGRSEAPLHGNVSSITHTGTSIFHGIPSPLNVARYHSLFVRSIPKEWMFLAETDDQERVIMAMQHPTLPRIGIQFHPESFLTESGEQLMQNFLSLS